jgi:hypothetical protein
LLGKISKLPLDKESKLKEGLGGVPRKESSILCFRGKNEENESVRKRLVFMCGKVLFMKKMCANKNMEGSCV